MKKTVGALVCIIFVSRLILMPFANADWTMFQADPAHTGVGTGNPVLTPTLLWKTNISRVFPTDAIGSYISWSSPAIANGIVYISSGIQVQSEDGYYRTSGVYSWSNVYAFNATNGTTIWDYRQNWSDGGSTPAVVNGVVFLGLSDYVAALNASDGASLWNFTAEVSSSPTVVDGIVYVGAYNSGNLYALNATNGDSIWNYTIGGIALSSPLLFSTA